MGTIFIVSVALVLYWQLFKQLKLEKSNYKLTCEAVGGLYAATIFLSQEIRKRKLDEDKDAHDRAIDRMLGNLEEAGCVKLTNMKFPV